jgi:hypothetical protein
LARPSSSGASRFGTPRFGCPRPSVIIRLTPSE